MSSLLPNARVEDLGRVLAGKQYQVGRGGRRRGAPGLVQSPAGPCVRANRAPKCQKFCSSRCCCPTLLPDACFRDPAPTTRNLTLPRCHRTSFRQVFVKDGQLYGFKGLAGKLGPIGVHASMLLCMAGFAMGAREHFACWWWSGR